MYILFYLYSVAGVVMTVPLFIQGVSKHTNE